MRHPTGQEQSRQEDEHFSRAVAALGITDAISELRIEMREGRHTMDALRGDLAETREAVAEIKGSLKGEARRSETSWRWREHFVEVAAAAGVILGSIGVFLH